MDGRESINFRQLTFSFRLLLNDEFFKYMCLTALRIMLSPPCSSQEGLIKINLMVKSTWVTPTTSSATAATRPLSGRTDTKLGLHGSHDGRRRSSQFFDTFPPRDLLLEPDQALQNFKALKCIDRRILCGSNLSTNVFELVLVL